MYQRARKTLGGNMNEFHEMARQEVLMDLMMELCITENQAEVILGKLIDNDPNYIIKKVRIMFGEVEKCAYRT